MKFCGRITQSNLRITRNIGHKLHATCHCILELRCEGAVETPWIVRRLRVGEPTHRCSLRFAPRNVAFAPIDRSYYFNIYSYKTPQPLHPGKAPSVFGLVVDIGGEYKFVGSGTLIAFGNNYGVLTAEHVVNYAADERYRLNTKFGCSQKLRLSVAEFPHDISIDVSYLEIEITGIRKQDYYGPDLAFVKIPPSPLLSELKARKSFVDIAVLAEERFENASINSGSEA
jgi:hypothetical protein